MRGIAHEAGPYLELHETRDSTQATSDAGEDVRNAEPQAGDTLPGELPLLYINNWL